MGWQTLTSGTVTSGQTSDRVNLNPGEIAHVQVEYVSGTTNRILVSVFATNEDDPGVVYLDTIPMLEFRLPASGQYDASQPGRVSFPVGPGIYGFAIRIDDDQAPAQAVSAFVRVRKDGVDLTTAPA